MRVLLISWCNSQLESKRFPQCWTIPLCNYTFRHAARLRFKDVRSTFSFSRLCFFSTQQQREESELSDPHYDSDTFCDPHCFSAAPPAFTTPLLLLLWFAHTFFYPHSQTKQSRFRHWTHDLTWSLPVQLCFLWWPSLNPGPVWSGRNRSSQLSPCLLDWRGTLSLRRAKVRSDNESHTVGERGSLSPADVPGGAGGAEGETTSWGRGEENKTEVEYEEEWGGEERGREAARAGATGSHRASRSGLLNRGTGVMSAPEVSHAPWAPEDSREEGQGRREKWEIIWSRMKNEAQRRERRLPDSEVEGWDLGTGGVDTRGRGASTEKGEGEVGRAMDLTIWGLKVWERPIREERRRQKRSDKRRRRRSRRRLASRQTAEAETNRRLSPHHLTFEPPGGAVVVKQELRRGEEEWWRKRGRRENDVRVKEEQQSFTTEEIWTVTRSESGCCPTIRRVKVTRILIQNQ